MAKTVKALARVNRVIRWTDGNEYTLRRGKPVEAPAEVVDFLRRVGYAEPESAQDGKRKEG